MRILRKVSKSLRSQNSLEQISGYGVALLVVVISIAALAYYGVFKSDEYFPDTCSFSTPDLACADFVINPSPAGNITLYVKNNLGRPIYNFSAVFVDLDDIYNQGVDKGERVRFDISYTFYTKTSGVYTSHSGTGKLVAHAGNSITGSVIAGLHKNEARLLETTTEVETESTTTFNPVIGYATYAFRSIPVIKVGELFILKI